ncbi:hypothetical protein, partial [Sinorhizobium meliloti]|uniref:hypothetical protein n=1 Tax=Rhizobium meliloti TaxID=382 RepID=UPI003F161333
IMPGFIHGFIHDSKHGTSAISNHPVPLLQMKSLSRGLNQQRKGGLFVALTMRFNLADNAFPVFATKKVFWRNASLSPIGPPF